MTTVADHILRRLARIVEHGDAFETAGEIGVAINATTATVNINLKRLAEQGKVRKAGEAFNGAKTWTIVEGA